MKTDGSDAREPEIKDLLSDPVLLAVLKSDGIKVEDLKQVIASYHHRISEKEN